MYVQLTDESFSAGHAPNFNDIMNYQHHLELEPCCQITEHSIFGRLKYEIVLLGI